MDVRLLSVPWDSAHRARRMGAGPLRLVESGVEQRLRQSGHVARIEEIVPSDGNFRAEIRTAFALNRALAPRVAAARADGALPVTLAGNCITAIGTRAGLGDDPVGVLWFDAHADFNTPDTTTSGFLDGMALSALTGRCWLRLAETVPGFRTVPDQHVVLIGARALDPLEEALLARSAVTRIAPRDVPSRLNGSLEMLATQVRSVYVHLDLDVLDPAEGRANRFAVARGLSLDDVLTSLESIARHFRIAAAAVTAYDPACDRDDRICLAATRLIDSLASLA